MAKVEASGRICARIALTLHLLNFFSYYLYRRGQKRSGASKKLDDTKWLRVTAQPVSILHSASQSLKTPQKVRKLHEVPQLPRQVLFNSSPLRIAALRSIQGWREKKKRYIEVERLRVERKREM